ncbi:MAG: hypothetical protein ACTJLL_03355 [Anaplasma sp.]
MFDYGYDAHNGGTASATFSDVDIFKNILMDGSDLIIQGQNLEVTSHNDEDPDSSAVYFTTKDGTPVAVFMGTAVKELFISFDQNSASVVFDIPPLVSLLDYEGDFTSGEEAQGYAGTIFMTLPEKGYSTPVAEREAADYEAELESKLTATPQPLVTVQEEDLQDVDTEALALAAADSLRAPQVEEAPQGVFAEVAELDVVEESLEELFDEAKEVEESEDESSAPEEDLESDYAPIEEASNIFDWM